MSKKKRQLKTVQPTNITPIDPNQAISPVHAALQSGADPDQLLKFMELQERYDANEARKSYSVAVAEFKKEDIYIPKDKINTQFDSKYSSKDALVSSVNPYLSKHGLSARWDLDVSELITVTCILSHKDGHSESVSFPAPADKSGKKNPIQEMKSTITYLEIVTYEAVTGVSSSGFGNDDGNSAYPPAVPRISEDQVLTIHAMITENEIDMDAVMDWLRTSLKCSGLEDININAYEGVINKVKATIKNKQRKEDADNQ